tara:strand:+ start:4332 stop:4544 length:213 start_codon:yes stop_codon:yes gene_type:complete
MVVFNGFVNLVSSFYLVNFSSIPTIMQNNEKIVIIDSKKIILFMKHFLSTGHWHNRLTLALFRFLRASPC